MQDERSNSFTDTESVIVTETKLDVLTMKLAIIQSKRDLESCQKQLILKQQKYENFVPKKDFLALNEKYENIKSGIIDLKKNFKITKQNLTELYDECLSLNKEKNYLDNNLKKVKRSKTPRPDWKFYSQYYNNLDTNELNLGENLQSEFLSTDEKICLISDRFYAYSLKQPNNLENIKFTNVMKHSNFRSFKKENLSKIKQIFFTNRDFFIICENLVFKKLVQDDHKKKICKMADFLHQYASNFPNQTELHLFDSTSWCLNIIYKAQDSTMSKYNAFLGQLINESIDLNLFIKFHKTVLELYFELEKKLNLESDILRKKVHNFLTNFMSNEKVDIPEKFEIFFDLIEENDQFLISYDLLESILKLTLTFIKQDDDIFRLKLLAMNDVEKFREERSQKLFDFRILFNRSHYGKLSWFMDQILDQVIKTNQNNKID